MAKATIRYVDPTEVESLNELQFILNKYGTKTKKVAFKPSNRIKPKLDDEVIPSVSELLHLAKNATSNLVDAALEDAELKEALNTKKTPKGVQIGDWEIEIKKVDNHKEFSLVYLPMGKKKYEVIGLYEVAHSLVRKFNKGLASTDPSILELLELDQSYQSRISDIMRFKKLMESSYARKDVRSAEVYRSRKEYAEAQVVQIKSKVSKIYKSI